MRHPILQVDRLQKVYGGEVALADASFTVDRGTVHGLVGANGAGKSTLVRIACGIEPQDGGTIAIDGERLPVFRSAAAARALGVACIDQDRALIPELSIAENVALALGYPSRAGLVSLRRMRWQAAAALRAVDLAHDVEAPVSELSISGQTMVAVARALASDARLLFLDEPTANMDAPDAQRLFGRLRELAGRGVACVLITHALREALEVCDAITVLRNGRVVATRAAGELDERSLTTLMIGHELDGRAPARRKCTSTPRLRLHGVRSAGLGPLSLEVDRGEVVAVTGAADAGHLALAEVLIGTARLEAGTMQVDGARFEPTGVAEARRRGVVCVPADRCSDGVALEMSSRENLFLDGSRFRSRTRGIRARRERTAARAILSESRVVPTTPESRLGTLSGGNQQKVLLAKWLADDPSLLVLCEPTVGVDVEARHDLYERLRSACADGMAVLLASSDLTEVVELGDRVLVLRRGRPVRELAGAEASLQELHRLRGGSG